MWQQGTPTYKYQQTMWQQETLYSNISKRNYKRFDKNGFH